MTALGEFGYFETCKADLGRWWQADPMRFVTRSLDRLRWFVTGRYEVSMSMNRDTLKALNYGVPGVLAFIGSVALLVRRRGRVIVATLAIFPLIYTVCTFVVRYRLAIEPLVVMVGVIGAVESYRFCLRAGE